MQRVFQNFCESTTLHGFSYLYIAKSLAGKVFFSSIILAMSIIGLFFLATNYVHYSKSTLITTIETTTAPLSEAIFPSITVCNFNQLEASYLKDKGLWEDLDLRNLLIKRYMTGHQGNLTDEEENEWMPIILEALKFNFSDYPEYYGDEVGYDYDTPFWDGRQWCRNLFLLSRFENKSIPWSMMNKTHELEIGAYFYGTDFGSCCFLSGHADLEGSESDYLSLDASAKHGESKGLSILFNIELFNYGYINGKGAGLKIALHHHLDKPMMQFSSRQIRSGSEVQINLNPVVSYTTQAALDGLTPFERLCFVEGENNLTTLPLDKEFRYEMNNCLIDEGILKVYFECRCDPIFSNEDPYQEFLPECQGKNLFCANEVTKTMGLIYEEGGDFR